METYAEMFADESFPNHPHLAYWRAVTGSCALAAGDRPRAKQLAEQARQAFTLQPRVSPYYKAALLTLEERLKRT